MRSPARVAVRRLSTHILHQLRTGQASHIDLEQIDVDLFRAPRANLWVPPASRAVFGGQVMGQALHAASRTVDGALGPHSARTFGPASLHAYFLLRGEADADILYRVRSTADLRSFASRSVDAVQRGRTIFSMQAQFAAAGQIGFEHTNPMPTDVPPPEDCPSMRDALLSLRTRAPSSLQPLIDAALVTPVEVRYASSGPEPPDLLDWSPPAVWPARQLMWVKTAPIREEDRLDEACAAYLSDQPLLMTALLPHSVRYPSPRLGLITTLDHSMWFHRPFRADDWLLYEMNSPVSTGGLALSFGHLYCRESKQLVVSCAQQGALRRARPTASRELVGAAVSLGMRVAQLQRWLRSWV
jgi:acyl-CoA thioesterase 8